MSAKTRGWDTGWAALASTPHPDGLISPWQSGAQVQVDGPRWGRSSQSGSVGAHQTLSPKKEIWRFSAYVGRTRVTPVVSHLRPFFLPLGLTSS
jgi:hypothetical protein